MVPVYFRSLKKKTANRRSAFLLREDSIQADEAACDLNTQLRTFVLFFKWLNSQWHICEMVEGHFVDLAICRLPHMLVVFSCFRMDAVLARHCGTVGLLSSTFNLKAHWRPVVPGGSAT